MKKLTSFKINKELLNKFKVRCAKEGKTMTQVVTDLIEDYSRIGSVDLYFVNRVTKKGAFLKVCKASDILSLKSDNVTLEVFKISSGGLVPVSREEVIKITRG